MTQDELNKIIKRDPYMKERKEPTEFECKLFLREVDFHCPLCGEEILYRGQKKRNKLFQIAHIYPNRPTIEQYEVLKNVERLGDDCESFENKIALCLKCHLTQDYQTSLEDYSILLNIKKRLLEKSALNDAVRTLDIEKDISKIITKLVTVTTSDLAELNYDPVTIAKKFETKDLLIKSHIEQYVHIYYPYIRDCLKEIDGINGFNQQVLAGQIRICFLKMSGESNDKSLIFNQMVEWLKSKTQSTSKEACEAIISFFVQQCEVFDEITE